MTNATATARKPHCLSCNNAFDMESAAAERRPFGVGYFSHTCDQPGDCGCYDGTCGSWKQTPKPTHACGTEEWDRGYIYATRTKAGRPIWRCSRCAFSTRR